jgi:hypothetical protein
MERFGKPGGTAITVQILSVLVIIAVSLFVIVLLVKNGVSEKRCSRFGVRQGELEVEASMQVAPPAYQYNYYLDLISYTSAQFLPVYSVGKEVQTVSKVMVNGRNYLSDRQAMGIVMVTCKKGNVAYSKMFNTHLAKTGNDILFYSMLKVALVNSDSDLLILVAHNGVGDLGNIADKIRLLQKIGIAKKIPLAYPKSGVYYPYILVYDIFNKKTLFEAVGTNTRSVSFKNKVVLLQLGTTPKALEF